MLSTEMRHDGRTALVVMDNPRAHNTLSPEFWTDFPALLKDLEAQGVRSIVLTGAGERAFSAGGDLISFSRLTGYDDRRAYMAACFETFAAMERSGLIIIAAVNGMALGGGCELAFASDFVIAAEDAEFGLPEANFGLMPAFGAFRGAEILGRQAIKHLICVGDRLSAQRAQALGLVLDTVPRAAVVDHALDLAKAISEKAPIAVRACKRVANRGLDASAFEAGVDLVTLLQGTEDVAEGLTAFKERRAPRFRGV